MILLQQNCQKNALNRWKIITNYNNYIEKLKRDQAQWPVGSSEYNRFQDAINMAQGSGSTSMSQGNPFQDSTSDFMNNASQTMDVLQKMDEMNRRRREEAERKARELARRRAEIRKSKLNLAIEEKTLN